jgi:hypothetical protein
MAKFSSTDRLLPEIQFSINRKQLREAERLLLDVKGAYPKVLKRAIKRSLQSGRTDISKAVRNEIVLHKRDVDARIALKFIDRGNVHSTGVITISRKPVTLRLYGAVQRRAGVSVKVRKSEGRKILKHTFMHKSRTGRETVNERQFKSGVGGKRVGRLLIEPRYGPTVHGVFESNPLGARAVRDLGVVFERRLDHETSFELRKAAARNNARA